MKIKTYEDGSARLLWDWRRGMSQKNFTSHGYPIPGAPYRPDQQPRNVARCGGPGLCPDCSREAGLWNRKNRMTTIDHQQAAVDSIRMWLLGLGSLTLDEVNDLAPKFVTAATPHLRAETVDRLKNFRNDYQHTYAIPGDPYADGYLTACNAIIALLEGGGEDK